MTLPELLDWIARYDHGVYALLLAYCLAKTGPLPMLAGFAAAQGALRLEVLWPVALLGTVAGAQLRFVLGRWASPWICSRFATVAPWLALSSAGVERYSSLVLLVYRFVKGTFSLVGLGAGASLLPWHRFSAIDALGAGVWVSAMVGMGWAFGSLGAALDPRWSAYVGLSLLVLVAVGVAVAGRRLKQRLWPLANAILQERTGGRGAVAWSG